jgi:hypothetical protein
MPPAQFSVDPAADEGFFIIVGEELTVYESYAAAVDDVEDKITTETDSFLAEVTIENDDSEDVAISLEQVGWQQIIADMTTTKDGEGQP